MKKVKRPAVAMKILVLKPDNEAMRSLIPREEFLGCSIDYPKPDGYDEFVAPGAKLK